MKNTSLKLTSSGAAKLKLALESLPKTEQDPTWNMLLKDVQKIIDIWEHIDIKQAHRARIAELVKDTDGPPFASASRK